MTVSRYRVMLEHLKVATAPFVLMVVVAWIAADQGAALAVARARAAAAERVCHAWEEFLAVQDDPTATAIDRMVAHTQLQEAMIDIPGRAIAGNTEHPAYRQFKAAVALACDEDAL